MNNKVFIKLIIIVFMASFLAIWGCKSKKVVVHEEVAPPKTPEEVFSQLKLQEADFEWFSARFAGSAIWQGRNYSIGGSIRIKKDSAIFVSITPVLGIEVARALITPDTVMFINRLESSYYVGGTEFINKKIGANIDYYMLQSLITGNDFPHFETENFSISNERDMIRIINPERRNLNNSDIVFSQRLFVDPDKLKIKHNLISDNEGRVVSANYSTWENIQEQLFPSSMDFIFSDKNTRAEVFLRFNRIEINVPQNIGFRIPARYDQIFY